MGGGKWGTGVRGEKKDGLTQWLRLCAGALYEEAHPRNAPSTHSLMWPSC